MIITDVIDFSIFVLRYDCSTMSFEVFYVFFGALIKSFKNFTKNKINDIRQAIFLLSHDI